MIDFFTRFAGQDVHRVVGLMSGTSADGVDAVLAELRGGGDSALEVRVLSAFQQPFEPALRERILRACSRTGGSSAEICALNMLLGESFADAALGAIHTANLNPSDIDALGSHGQTIAHYPGQPGAGGSTLQIGSAAVIAERTGIVTVSNFRERDMAAGGQGAPLVPLADFLLFRSADKHRAALNIGGIANVTWLPAGAKLNDVLAFDTGPGNMILDALAAHVSGGEKRCDLDGELAADGRVCHPLLAELLTHPYFERQPPKSTGREDFGVEFAMDLFRRGSARGLSACDVLATATAFTAQSIAHALTGLADTVASSEPLELIVAGGGAHNPILMGLLRHYLREWDVNTSEAFKVGVTQRECVAFAILARETLLGRPGNVPSATGARGPRVLGDITLGARDEG